MPKGAKDNRGKPPTPEVEFWRQQEWESDEHYKKFAAYRDLGPARRLRAAAAIFYDMTDMGPSPYQYQHFKDLSYRNMWGPRVEAFDAEEDLRLMQEMQQRRQKMLEDHWRASKILMNGLVQKVYTWQRDPESIPNSQVASLFREASQLMRLTLGEATERLEQGSSDSDAARRQPDLSSLTDEEVAFLDDIGLKMYGPPSAEEQAEIVRRAKKGGKWKPPGKENDPAWKKDWEE